MEIDHEERILEIRAEAEVRFQDMKRSGYIIICCLPRIKPNISELVPYKPYLVLQDWN